MKKAVKVCIILAVCAAAVGLGIFFYARYTGSKPVTAYPARAWTMSYVPTESYLYGIAVSGDSEYVEKEEGRKILEVYVQKGDKVKIGDPLVLYDVERDLLTLEEKKLELEELQYDAREYCKQYLRYARQSYEPKLVTPAPAQSAKLPPLAAAYSLTRKQISSHTVLAVTGPTGGTGASGTPYLYSCEDGDTIPYSLLQFLSDAAAAGHSDVFAEIKGTAVCAAVRAGEDGSFSFSFSGKKTGGKTDLDKPVRGNGSSMDPFVYDYASGDTVPAAFSLNKSLQAAERSAYVFVLLQSKGFTVSLQYGPDGSVTSLWEELAPTPSPSPSPTPVPSVSPSPTATGSRGGIPLEERMELAAEALTKLHELEVKSRQLALDIEKLESGTSDGILRAAISGTVTAFKNPSDAREGETIIELSGDASVSVYCLIGEADRDKYPLGTRLEGYSYESGRNIGCTVSEIGTTPLSESYDNGGGINNSAYLMKLSTEEGYTPSNGEYLEFSGFDTPLPEGTVYLYEAFIGEDNGRSCIYVARDGIVTREYVTVGSRYNQYVELRDTTLSEEDAVVFPGERNCRDGARATVSDKY